MVNFKEEWECKVRCRILPAPGAKDILNLQRRLILAVWYHRHTNCDNSIEICVNLVVYQARL